MIYYALISGLVIVILLILYIKPRKLHEILEVSMNYHTSFTNTTIGSSFYMCNAAYIAKKNSKINYLEHIKLTKEIDKLLNPYLSLASKLEVSVNDPKIKDYWQRLYNNWKSLDI